MAALKTPFFDTSVLVAGHIDVGPASVVPMAILDRLTEGELPGACTAWHCCLEFYSVATRLPEEYRLDPVDAATLLDSEILPRFKVGDLPGGSRKLFIEQAARDRITGGRLYDRQIGFIAVEMGATVLVTENRRHFQWVHDQGIPVLSATEWLNQAGP